jgi:hypothetical protein
MTPVVQTETAPGRGNCLAACFASLLDLPAEEVPNFILERDFWEAIQKWLAARGLFAVRFVAEPAYLYPVPRTHCILTGRSPRRDVGHAVVGLAEDRGWRVVHDPHPDGTGLRGEPEWVIFLGKLA